MRDHSHLFLLRLKLPEGNLAIRAFEAGYYPGGNHTKLQIDVRLNGEFVFARGTLYVGIPPHKSIDGEYAKEAVLSCVAMKPGDTDTEYFSGYSAEQLAFAERYGEEIRMVAHDRYGEDPK